jgi:hypothetical protein
VEVKKVGQTQMATSWLKGLMTQHLAQVLASMRIHNIYNNQIEPYAAIFVVVTPHRQRIEPVWYSGEVMEKQGIYHAGAAHQKGRALRIR